MEKIAPFGYSLELRGRKSGENHPLFGKSRSEETKMSVLEGMKVWWANNEATESQIQHAREMAYKDGVHVNLGRKHGPRSEEHCKNLAVALLEFCKNNPRTEEHCRAISLAKTNVPLSIEHCQAISRGLQMFWGSLDYSEFPNFAARARNLTEKSYEENKAEINPNDLPRAQFMFHLDHIIPVVEGFKRGWKPEKVASPKNLQMLPWLENLRKDRKILINEEEIENV